MISVCMATYNGEKYLKEQIDSILIQLSIEDELIISDDGSMDTTLSILASYNDPRIHYMENKGKHGVVSNFENALKHAVGDYIFLCDQDDIWNYDKVKIVISKLKTNDLVVHDAELIDKDGKSMKKNYYSLMHQGTGFLSNLIKTRFLGCCMAFTKEVKEACLPFPKGIAGHDFWIGIYSILKFKVIFIDDILIKYRRHENNVSFSSEKSKNSLYKKFFLIRLPILFNILIRIFSF